MEEKLEELEKKVKLLENRVFQLEKIERKSSTYNDFNSIYSNCAYFKSIKTRIYLSWVFSSSRSVNNVSYYRKSRFKNG